MKKPNLKKAASATLFGVWATWVTNGITKHESQIAVLRYNNFGVTEAAPAKKPTSPVFSSPTIFGPQLKPKEVPNEKSK